MDILRLPDEMCNSILKYSKWDTRNQCRRISKRINDIVIRYKSNKVPISSISIYEFLEKEIPHDRACPEAYNRLKRIENEQRPADDESRILFMSFNLDSNYFDGDLNNRSRTICIRFWQEAEKCQELDSLFSKIMGNRLLSINMYEYTDDLGDCLCRNKTALLHTKTMEFHSKKFACGLRNFNWLKELKKVYQIAVGKMKNFNFDEMLADYSGGICLQGGSRLRTVPVNIGDSFLLKWMDKIPKDCHLEGCRNNFTIPVFAKFLVKLILSEPKSSYHFGSMGGSEEDEIYLEGILKDNGIVDFSCSDNGLSLHYEIHLRNEEKIQFSLEN